MTIADDALAGLAAMADNPLPTPRMAEETASDPEYTIDELATLMRMPSRTIRFYQSKGALPGPQIRGRVAFYGPEHVERLKLIGSLQDRGLSIRAIRDLLTQVDQGELSLTEWLGLEQQLQEPWAQDSPRVFDARELRQLLGERPPGTAGELVRLGLLERRGDSYYARSPALLQVALRLEASGVDFETAVGSADILRKRLRKAAEELTSYFYRRSGEGFGRAASTGDLAAAYRALRPLGLEAARLVFAQEMERALRKLVDSGVTAQLPAKAAKRKRSGTPK